MYWKNVYSVLILVSLSGGLLATERPYETKSPNIAAEKESSSRRDWLYHGLEINYALLNVADMATTIYGLQRGAKEGNPLARSFVRSTPGVILVKSGLTFGVLWALRKGKEKNKNMAYATLGVLNIVYGVVVRNNIGVVLKLN